MSCLKLYAHTHLPERAVAWLEAARRRSYKDNPSTQSAHSRFLQLNEPRKPGLITMREGIQFLTHRESFQSFQWFCWRSPDMVDEYDRFASDCRGKLNFLDVGACHGVYSLTFATVNPGGRVIAVEPSPAARKILEYNISTNCLRNRVEVVSHAAGEDGSKMYAMQNWHHLEARKDSRDTVVVETRSIDAICDDHACRPDLIKIDVEGFELHVLQGARRVLSQRPVVYLEIHPKLTANLGYDHTKCFDLLDQMDYVVFEVNGAAMTRKEFGRRHHTFFTACR